MVQEKVYLIGQNGFIGKQLIKLIPSDQLVVLSRFDVGEVLSGEKKIKFYQEDVLINLAWEHLDNFKSSKHITEQLSMHTALYDAFIEMGLKNITTIGTCLEYGVAEGRLDEDRVPNPSIPYAIAKDSLRRYLEYKKNTHGINFNWLRLFYVYGEGQSDRTLYGQLVKAVEDNEPIFNMSPGDQGRDYLEVKDVANIVFRISKLKKSCGVVNCCSGISVSVKSFVESRKVELKSNIKLNLGHYEYANHEGFNFWGSVDKLNQLLGEK